MDLPCRPDPGFVTVTGPGPAAEAGRVVLPLAGIRVLDLTNGPGEMRGRLLADLGADVLLIEPPGGMASRRAEPVIGGIGLRFAVHNANKRSEIIDWRGPSGRDRLLELARSADILIENQRPGALATAGLGLDELHRVNPLLVVTSITDFGQTGPYRHWVGTDWVHMALNSVLSRSGLPDQAPLMPPGRLADETASAQAAWATLVALWAARHTRRGEHVDVSVLETSVQTLDTPYDLVGSVTDGAPAGRPDARHQYPIFRCADGYVRIASCPSASGGPCSPGSASPPNSPTRSTTRSEPGSLPPRPCTSSSASCSQTRPEPNWSRPAAARSPDRIRAEPGRGAEEPSFPGTGHLAGNPPPGRHSLAVSRAVSWTSTGSAPGSAARLPRPEPPPVFLTLRLGDHGPPRLASPASRTGSAP